MEVVFELVEVFICVLEAYLMFDFYMAFFPLREVFRKKYVKAAAVVVTAVCVRVVNCWNNSTVNIIAMQFIYLTMLFGVFYGNALKKVFCHLMALAIMMGSELLLMIALSHPSDFSLSQINNDESKLYIILLGIKTLAFVLFNIVKRFSHKGNNRLDLKNFILYSILPFGTLGIMISLANLNIDFDSSRFVQIILITCNMLVVVGNILIFYVFDRFSLSIEKLKQQEVLIARMELEEKRYEQIEITNQEHARFLHDIRHYMSTIGELAIENKEKEILDILSELQIKVSDAGTKIYCSNRLLNTILNEKKKEADEKSIRMEITYEPGFSIDQLENIDLIVIMGNLLDNAIEAAYRCKRGYVNLYLYTQNNSSFSIIKIVNNYTGVVKEKNGNILTNKDNATRHGFGIQNASAVAQKYGGYVDISYVGDIFTAIVLLPNIK